MICSRCYHVNESEVGICVACGKDPLLEGNYRLLEQVGQGASARTYKAVRLSDGQIVAVKELLFHRIDVLKTHELFEREARVLRQLSHRGIPRLIETFQVEEGRSLCFYLVQEFIEGQTLADEGITRRFSERSILEFLVALCEPVEYLHGLPVPVVHRDIKPTNLMRRSADDQLMLIDFGTVRDVLKPQGQGNTIAGTYGYMAPEQLMGDATSASDVYAIGATAVALLAGQELSGNEDCLRWLQQMNLSGATRQLFVEMLLIDPMRRPSIVEVCRQAQVILASGVVERELVMVPAQGMDFWTQNSGCGSLGKMYMYAFLIAGAFWLIAKVVGVVLSPSVIPATPVKTVVSEPRYDEFDHKSLGRFTLGMSVDEANQAAHGELEYGGEHSVWTTRYSRSESAPPFFGTRYFAPAVFGGTYARCELIFAVNDRLSEIQCGLIGPSLSENRFEYDEFEWKVQAELEKDHGSSVTNTRHTNTSEWVWRGKNARLGMVAGSPLEGIILDGSHAITLGLWLESAEHVRAVTALRDSFHAQRKAEDERNAAESRAQRQAEVERLQRLGK